ncbi:guanylate kinase [Candidatus Uabimicrobium amorphum]|uniref:Guanylate kinase n=1 Tax=Uabimicrobium amorphum TaxID=2596890 RepID=A0A5S9IKI7_UABAM|nr:guanylate kinase [Candidatus Uabimicrobium amorphum]BBM83563.1 guanylate kinase [Candidatus Uabimicrobium amorphum]
MSKFTPKIIIISGPSGVGKTSICEAIYTKISNIRRSVSATTRSKRAGEIDGHHYHFLAHDDFVKKIECGEFLEYAKVHDHYYGTLKQNIEEAFRKEQHCLVEIDVQGAKQIQQNRDFETVSIFIGLSNLDEIKKRLIERGSETQTSIDTRMNNMLRELEKKNEYDFYVENISLENSIEAIKKIILNA